MATPMTPAQLLAQLKKFGIRYAEYKDWATHNRNHVGKWGPVHGFMVHHTGSDAKDQRELLYAGVSGLPGPLCQFGLAQDGTVHLVGWGRANHAGLGDDDVLAAVINETALPVDDESNTDGNARFYGVEIWYSGSHPMTSAQYVALRKLAAAICDFHGWSEASVIGHGEWGSPGKWDPGFAPGKMMDMGKVRADVAVTIAASKPVEPAPAPIAPKPVPKPPVPAKPKYEPYPGAAFFKAGRKSPIIAAMHKRLVAVGCNKYRSHTNADTWGSGDTRSYRAWQLKCGATGAGADGVPGKATWDKLQVPNV